VSSHGTVGPRDLAVSPSGAHVATRAEVDGPIDVWTVATATPSEVRPKPPPGTLLALGERGRSLIVGRRAQTWLWDARLAFQRARLSQQADAATVNGRDLTALVVESTGTGLVRRRLVTLPAQGAAWLDPELPDDPNPQFVEQTRADGGALLLQIRSEEGLRGLAWDASSKRWTASSADASTGAGAAGRLQVTIAETHVLATGPNGPQVQIDIPEQVMRASASADGRFVATLDLYGTAKLHVVAPGDLIAQACARVPRPLPDDLRRLVPGGERGLDACGRTPAQAARR